MNELASMFIDDELTLDDKVSFVEAVHVDRVFKDETIGLLIQEKVLRAPVVAPVPEVRFEARPVVRWRFLRPMYVMGAALAAIFLVLVMKMPLPEKVQVPYRFVLYQPDATRVDIAGSFTDWQAIPLKKTGNKGYWETTMEVPTGEHRLCYIIEGVERIPDPTIAAREKDDFGGENSILEVHNKS